MPGFVVGFRRMNRRQSGSFGLRLWAADSDPGPQSQQRRKATPCRGSCFHTVIAPMVKAVRALLHCSRSSSARVLAAWKRPRYQNRRQIAKRRIVSFHLNDVAEAGKPQTRDVPPGAGVANDAGVFEELLRRRFQGGMAVEYEHDSKKLLIELAGR